MVVSGHPIAQLMDDAAHGRFPPSDGSLDLLPPVDGVAALVLSFSGHNFIATDLDRTEIEAHLPSADVGAPTNPVFLAWLSSRLGSGNYTPDLVTSSFRTDADPSFALVERDDLDEHPRVAMARRYRRDVRVWSDTLDKGLLTIGRSFYGPLEVSVEVKPEHRGKGIGRHLAQASRSLIPEDEPLFAGVSPANAASLRAFLAAGFEPIGSLVALVTGAIREARPV